MNFAALAFALALAVLACSACERARQRDRAVTRDSAGVRIVENVAPRWDSAAWRVSAVPELEFGPAESLYRVSGALRLGSGRIVVAHGSANELLFYSPAGELQKRVGRTGSGPGEFRELSRVFLFGAGDSLLVYDLPQLRATVFDTTGTVVRTFAPAQLPHGRLGFVSAAFDDGSLLVAGLTISPPETRGLIRPQRPLYRTAAAGDVVHLVDMPGEETFFQETPFGPVDRRRPFFGHTSSFAAAYDRLYWAATDTFEIRVHDRTGRLLSIIRKPHEYRAISAADVAPLITRQLASVEDADAQRTARRLLENIPVGTRAPAFGWPVWATRRGPDLQLDDDANLWIVEYFMPDAERNARMIFDSTGVWLGSVALPPGFAPTHIGTDFMLGISRDRLDVERIQLYRLHRPRA